jgi:hypothetical protein|tara:strand:+ start:522 stop:1040 length:519 start_codon:yes stop_codon:yes gene_type:complete
MACSNLTAGILDLCNDGFGGIQEIFLANGPVDSFAETAGLVTAITVSGSALTPADFFAFEVPRQTSTLNEVITPTQENGTVTYQQDVTMIFNQMQAEKRNQILLMAQATTMVAVAKDGNGKYWSVGLEFGAYMSAGTATSGTAYADRNGYEITISGMEKTPMFEVTGSIVQA